MITKGIQVIEGLDILSKNTSSSDNQRFYDFDHHGTEVLIVQVSCNLVAKAQ
jgi:hypothetical protein